MESEVSDAESVGWLSALLGIGGAAGMTALAKQLLAASATESRIGALEETVDEHGVKLDAIGVNIATLVERTSRADEDRKEILTILRTPRG